MTNNNKYPYKKHNERYKNLRLETYNNEKDKCYTVRELADKMTNSKNSSYYSRISQIELGQVRPSPADMKYYRKFFNVSYEFLMGETDNKKIETYNIGKELSLSDETIEVLKKWNGDNDTYMNLKPFINQIFPEESFNMFLIMLHRYIFGSPTYFIHLSKGKEVIKLPFIDVVNENESVKTQLVIEDIEYIYERALLKSIEVLKEDILKKYKNEIDEIGINH